MTTQQNSIKKAQAALQAKRESGEMTQPERLDPIEKAIRLPASLAAAIKAQCWECVGRGEVSGARKDISCCTIWGCALWPLRPWQRLAPAGFGEEQRQEAIRMYPPRSTLAIAAKQPTHKRKAVRAMCANCMGHDTYSSRLIEACPSKFPRAPQNGHRGCPLWPHRTGGVEV